MQLGTAKERPSKSMSACDFFKSGHLMDIPRSIPQNDQNPIRNLNINGKGFFSCNWCLLTHSEKVKTKEKLDDLERINVGVF